MIYEELSYNLSEISEALRTAEALVMHEENELQKEVYYKGFSSESRTAKIHLDKLTLIRKYVEATRNLVDEEVENLKNG